MAFDRLTRRRVLKVGMVSAGVLVGGGASASLWLRGCPADVSGLRILDAHQYRTLACLVEALFTHDAGFGVDVASFDLPRAFDSYLADEPEDVASDLGKALFLLEIGPVLDDHRAHPFSRLTVAERAAFFESWMQGDDLTRRKITIALRKFFNLTLYDRREMWAHIGYPGPSLGGG